MCIRANLIPPDAFAIPLKRFASLLDGDSNSSRDLPAGDVRGRIGVLDLMHRVVAALPETREPFWRVFTACARDNPSALRIIVAFIVLYLHLRPFSRLVIAAIDRRIAALGGQGPPTEGKPSAAPSGVRKPCPPGQLLLVGLLARNARSLHRLRQYLSSRP